MKKRKCRNIVMGDETWERLRDLAKKEERSISDLVREATLYLLRNRDADKLSKKYDPLTDQYR